MLETKLCALLVHCVADQKISQISSMPPKVVNQAALIHFFTAIVEYCCKTNDPEGKLRALGMSTGIRLLDILYLREKPFRRETRLLGLLQFIAGPVWKAVFGRAADLTESSDEYFIIDKQLIFNRYISPPPGQEIFNCGGAWAAGLVEGILRTAEFPRTVQSDFSAEKVEDDWISTTLAIKK